MQKIAYTIENWTLIKLFGGLAVIFSGLPAYFGNILLEKLKLNWKSKTDKEIEELKGVVQKTNSTIGSFTMSFFNNLQKIQEKRVEGSEILWGAVLGIKEAIPSIVSTYLTILTNEEFNKEVKNNLHSQEIKELDEHEFGQKFYELEKAIHKWKPFFGEKFFLLFNSYGGFVGRTVYQFINNYKNNNPKDWKDDRGIQNLLKSMLSKEEYDKLHTITISRFSVAIELIEYKLLQEIKSNIGGKENAIDSVKYIKEFEDILTAKNASKMAD